VSIIFQEHTGVFMARGGTRQGAGRPRGKGPWGEKTIPMRVPASLFKGVTQFMKKRGYRLPLYASHVPAGTPSQPGDDVEDMTDLNTLLLKDPENSFLLRVKGDSMINAGIHDGDLLVVDRSLEPANGKIVVATIDGQATVKRFKRNQTGIELLPENPNYQPLHIAKNQKLDISGIVIGCIRKY
jgi:DNA polymerase V